MAVHLEFQLTMLPQITRWVENYNQPLRPPESGRLQSGTTYHARHTSFSFLWVHSWAVSVSVSNGSKPLGWFQVRVGTWREPVQWGLPQEQPGPLLFGWFPVKTPALAGVAVSLQLSIIVVIVLWHKLYVNDAGSGALSHDSLRLWIWAIFVV